MRFLVGCVAVLVVQVVIVQGNRHSNHAHLGTVDGGGKKCCCSSPKPELACDQAKSLADDYVKLTDDGSTGLRQQIRYLHVSGNKGSNATNLFYCCKTVTTNTCSSGKYKTDSASLSFLNFQVDSSDCTRVSKASAAARKTLEVAAAEGTTQAKAVNVQTFLDALEQANTCHADLARRSKALNGFSEAAKKIVSDLQLPDVIPDVVPDVLVPLPPVIEPNPVGNNNVLPPPLPALLLGLEAGNNVGGHVDVEPIIDEVNKDADVHEEAGAHVDGVLDPPLPGNQPLGIVIGAALMQGPVPDISLAPTNELVLRARGNDIATVRGNELAELGKQINTESGSADGFDVALKKFEAEAVKLTKFKVALSSIEEAIKVGQSRLAVEQDAVSAEALKTSKGMAGATLALAAMRRSMDGIKPQLWSDIGELSAAVEKSKSASSLVTMWMEKLNTFVPENAKAMLIDQLTPLVADVDNVIARANQDEVSLQATHEKTLADVKVPCVASNWVENDCKGTCGMEGTLTRTRNIVTRETNGGPCDETNNLSDTGSCTMPACVPVPCVASAWTNTDCISATPAVCGVKGTLTRTRTIVTEAKDGGPCPENGSLTEPGTVCDMRACVNCKVSEWAGKDGPCVPIPSGETCGAPGSRTLTREKTEPEESGGSCTDPLSMAETCTLLDCPPVLIAPVAPVGGLGAPSSSVGNPSLTAVPTKPAAPLSMKEKQSQTWWFYFGMMLIACLLTCCCLMGGCYLLKVSSQER